jgi:hypothetical protein
MYILGKITYSIYIYIYIYITPQTNKTRDLKFLLTFLLNSKKMSVNPKPNYFPMHAFLL